MKYFATVKEGSRVYSIIYGWGTVTYVTTLRDFHVLFDNEEYLLLVPKRGPINFRYHYEYDYTGVRYNHLTGLHDKKQTLFWGEPQIIVSIKKNASGWYNPTNPHGDNIMFFGPYTSENIAISARDSISKYVGPPIFLSYEYMKEDE